MQASRQQSNNADPVFEPRELGSFALKNKLVALPLYTGFARPDGGVSSLLLEHYKQWAETGVSMVVVGNVAVAEDGRTTDNSLLIDKDALLPGLKRLSQVIKRTGIPACLQLNHAGRFAETDKPLLPSPVLGKHLAFDTASLKAFMESFPLEQRFGLTRRLMNKAVNWQSGMTDEERNRVVGQFVNGARRACEAGFDMVELHGATGYLITQYLSAYTNHIESGYGGTFEERARFPLEIVRKIKERLPDLPLGFRLLVREWVPDGIDIHEAVRFARMLEQEGIAYLSIAAGTYNSLLLPKAQKSMKKPAYLQEDAAELKKVVSLPIIISGRIPAPVIARKVLKSGDADFIGLARSLLADPQWVHKAANKDDCNIQGCKDCWYCLKRVVRNKPVTCVRQPRTHRRGIELERMLINRNWMKSLVVVADPNDIRLLKSHWPERIPRREEAEVRILMPVKPDRDKTYDAALDEFEQWILELWSKLGKQREKLTIVRKAWEEPAEEIILQDAKAYNCGVVVLGMNKEQKWREECVQKFRNGLISLVNTHSGQTKILFAFDGSQSSLLSLKHVVHTYWENPALRIRFVHIAEEKDDAVLSEWQKAKELTGFEDGPDLEVVVADDDISQVVLRTAEQCNCGMIVMGRRGMSGFRRFFLGSVSAGVLKNLQDQSLTIIG